MILPKKKCFVDQPRFRWSAVCIFYEELEDRSTRSPGFHFSTVTSTRFSSECRNASLLAVTTSSRRFLSRRAVSLVDVRTFFDFISCLVAIAIIVSTFCFLGRKLDLRVTNSVFSDCKHVWNSRKNHVHKVHVRIQRLKTRWRENVPNIDPKLINTSKLRSDKTDEKVLEEDNGIVYFSLKCLRLQSSKKNIV